LTKLKVTDAVGVRNRVTPRLRNFAKRLIECEERAKKPSAADPPPSFPVQDRLHSHLAALIGQGGFRALLWRARGLAVAELPWLSSVQIKADGSLEEGDEHYSQLEPDKFLEGRVILLAQLLGLLETFIGESLTTLLVHEVWPEVPRDELDFSQGGADEKRG